MLGSDLIQTLQSNAQNYAQKISLFKVKLQSQPVILTSMQNQLLESRYIELSEQQRSRYLSQSNYIYKSRSLRQNFFQQIRSNLGVIKIQKNQILQDFNQFKQQMVCKVNMTMGKIASNYHKTLNQKSNLQQQLKKTKESQQKMKMEVMQLRQMIDEFLKSYSKQVSMKDRQIQQLKDILQKNQIGYIQLTQQKEQSIECNQNTTKLLRSTKANEEETIQQKKITTNNANIAYSPTKLTQQSMIQLDPIQQQSERTVSNGTSNIETLRSEHPSAKAKQDQSQFQSMKTSTQKKKRKFIQDFRRSIASSYNGQDEQENRKSSSKQRPSEKNRSPSQAFKKGIYILSQHSQRSQQRPLKNLALFDENIVKVDASKCQDCCFGEISKNSSSNNLTSLGNTNKINVPIKSQNPKGISFINQANKRLFPSQKSVSSKNIVCQNQKTKFETSPNNSDRNQFSKNQRGKHRRFMTEDSLYQDRQNINTQVQLTPISLKSKSRLSSGQKITLSRNGLFSNSKQAKRNGSGSKQKIKVFSKSKLRQENYQTSYQISTMKKNRNLSNNSYLHSHRKNKASVHLGNKNYLNKMKRMIKNALKQYQIKQLKQQQELFYKGELINYQRKGFGKLHYQNGLTYEGNFEGNTKNGKGSLFINGNIIFDGNWQSDKIQGQGTIKALDLLADNCQQCLKGAIYLGQFASNKFHGIGTLYLANKQKIVTKFASGIPYGQFTLYSAQNIQFGVWPQ